MGAILVLATSQEIVCTEPASKESSVICEVTKNGPASFITDTRNSSEIDWPPFKALSRTINEKLNSRPIFESVSQASPTVGVVCVNCPLKIRFKFGK